MKALLENHRGIDYLTFRPKGMNSSTILPVITKGNRDKANAWTWNGSLEAPTLRPSIRTKYTDEDGEWTEIHYWLTDGVCHCLSDCKDGNSGKEIELENQLIMSIKEILEEVETGVKDLLKKQYSGVFNNIKKEVEQILINLKKDLTEVGTLFLSGELTAKEFESSIRAEKDTLFIKLIGMIGAEQIRAEKLKDEFVNLVIGTFNKD